MDMSNQPVESDENLEAYLNSDTIYNYARLYFKTCMLFITCDPLQIMNKKSIDLVQRVKITPRYIGRLFVLLMLYFIFKYFGYLMETITKRKSIYFEEVRWNDGADMTTFLTNLINNTSMLYIYQSLISSTVVLLIYIMFVYNKTTLNSLAINLIIQPLKERRRLNKEMVKKFDSIIGQNGIRIWKIGSDFKLSSNQYLNTVEKVKSLRKLINFTPEGTKTRIIQPTVCNDQWIKNLSHYLIWLLGFCVLVVGSLSVALPLLRLLNIIVKRCQDQVAPSRTSCGLIDNVSFGECRWAIEMIIGMNIFGLIMASLVIMMLLTGYVQLVLIYDLEGDLKQVLNNASSMEYNDTLMLTLLVKLLVISKEIKRNVRSVSCLVELFIFCYSLMIFSSIYSGLTNKSGSNAFNVLLFVFNVITLNSILLCWAFIYAKTVKLERLIWSLLSQELIAKAKRKEPISLIIMNSWLRLAHSNDFSDINNSVRPFMMSITYKRVIEINFVVFSLFSFKNM